MTLNIFDIFIIFVLLIFAITGWKNGVIKELVGFIGFILVFTLSFCFKGVLGNLLCIYFPFFKFSGYIKGLSTLNIFIYQLIAFFLLFAIFLCLYRILLKASKTLQKIVNCTVILLIPSKILGALVAILEGWLVTFAILIIVMVPFQRQDEFKKSKFADFIIDKTPILSKSTSSFINSVEEVYDLSSKISMEELEVNEANIQSIDIMLKYKIVNKKTIERLIKDKKLENIKNVEKVLKKY